MVRSLRPDYRIHVARNGKEALELAGSKPLDIVFTDIQMPVVNGLEFLEQLSAGSAPHNIRPPKVVFVSVYHEFDYARKALRLGAKDYLMKPVSVESLEAILIELEGQLEEERSKRSEQQKLSERLAHVQPVYLEHLLYRWMTEPLAAQELAELRRLWDTRGRGTVLVLRSGPANGSVPGPDPGEWSSLLRQAVQVALHNQALAAVLAPKQAADADKLYVIIHWHEEAADAPCLERLQTALGTLGKLYNMSVCGGVSWETADLEAEIRLCYESANTAMEYLYYMDDNSWLDVRTLQALRGRHQPYLAAAPETDELEEAIVEGQIEQAAALLLRQIDQMATGYPAPFRLKCSLISLLLTCLKRVEAVLDKGAFAELSERIDREVLPAASFACTKTGAAGLLTAIMNQTKLDKNARSELIMRKCKEFVDDHLHEDLGLPLVAQQFFYNSSYFSILFKQHFGLSFTDYLVKTRMQKARTLLLQTELRVAEVARQVGYKECKYFNKVFKKMFLYSPEEFRRMFAAAHKE